MGGGGSKRPGRKQSARYEGDGAQEAANEGGQRSTTGAAGKVAVAVCRGSPGQAAGSRTEGGGESGAGYYCRQAKL